MATYTSVLNLRKAHRAAGDDDIVNVGLDLNNNLDIIDLNIGLRVCTSSTRPATPFTGQMIYETDTDFVMLWNGTSWESYGYNKSSKGRVGYNSSQTDSANFTSASAETLYLSASFTRETDRLYLVESGFFSECVVAAGVGTGTARIRIASGGSVANTDTLLGETLLRNPQGTGTSNSEHWYTFFNVGTGASGTHTVGLFMQGVGVGDTMRFDGNTDRTNWLSIRDVGA